MDGRIPALPLKTRRLSFTSKVEELLARPSHLVLMTIEEYALRERHDSPVCTAELEDGCIHVPNTFAEQSIYFDDAFFCARSIRQLIGGAVGLTMFHDVRRGRLQQESEGRQTKLLAQITADARLVAGSLREQCRESRRPNGARRAREGVSRRGGYVEQPLEDRRRVSVPHDDIPEAGAIYCR